ncbi:hypothetical protein G7076_04725 [Sphingomonas sp. HDW15A]|uniref:hypothetical protein n=1 Tax=Sphingomonas sp. HDW15A TaxID=2714942 RepID=UPI00140B8266|nr:hypothetical protein [Sphingomonas sp. HDW15A]QIK95863.1 hypothetical protein G7076_04725 [Sphingomonas sp. HDW15A]
MIDKSSLLMRTLRNRHDNAVWWWQQTRVRRAVLLAFEAENPLALDQQLKLEGGWPDAIDPSPVVLAACDEGYFYRFGQHLALSSAAQSPESRVHLHVYDPSEECRRAIDALKTRCEGHLTVSIEGLDRNPHPAPKSFFYAAGRFAVASRMRKDIAAPILMIDADGLVANHLSAGFAGLGDVEAGFILQPENAPLYRKILASAIYLGIVGDMTAEFFTRLSDGIGLALAEGGHYHVDQIGIHYALEWCRQNNWGPAIHDLALEWSDYDFRPESLIWSTKGARKDRYEELLATVETL